jgi:hypothetical protein
MVSFLYYHAFFPSRRVVVIFIMSTSFLLLIHIHTFVFSDRHLYDDDATISYRGSDLLTHYHLTDFISTDHLHKSSS